MGWWMNQLEWCKGFFMTDGNPNLPSHKNLIGIAVVAVFLIAYMKKLVGASELPDIPSGWQLVLLGILGIRSAQSVLEKKFSNGNGDKDANTTTK
jgi:hypothetical protein